MKLISYNVNGIRAAMEKGLVSWLQATNADILCLQETKALKEQVKTEEFEKLGYESYWFSAQKKGYSGTAIFTKIKPIHVEYGLNIEKFDFEGRAIRIDFENFSILNVYMPSGTSGDERQQFKYDWLDSFYNYINDLKLKIPNLLICGDYNICHKSIDIHNPISNAKTSGFLPEERAWMDKFFNAGFIDTFRYFNEEPHHYTWWTYRANARAKNLGWRIDYWAANEPLKDRLKKAYILKEAVHSDHCPIVVEID